MGLIDKYTQSGLISDPTRNFRQCESCEELFHPNDLNTVDTDRYGEHTTIEVCDNCLQTEDGTSE